MPNVCSTYFRETFVATNALNLGEFCPRIYPSPLLIVLLLICHGTLCGFRRYECDILIDVLRMKLQQPDKLTFKLSSFMI